MCECVKERDLIVELEDSFGHGWEGGRQREQRLVRKRVPVICQRTSGTRHSSASRQVLKCLVPVVSATEVRVAGSESSAWPGNVSQS